MTFHKYQGTGNDFIIIDNRNHNFPKKDSSLIASLCDRHFGIGADGLILLEDHENTDFSMIYFNGDGFESGFCGNGSRCITHLAKKLNIIEKNAVFSAIDGIHESRIFNGKISVKMNKVLKADIYKYDDNYNTTFINTGSPHLIRLFHNIDTIDVVNKAKEIKLKYPDYTEGLNINFCEISDSIIKLRTYERGVEDETLSCGTGAVASAIFLKESGLVNYDKIQIQMKGGKLSVDLTDEGDFYSDIWLSGDVNMVFKGVYNKFD